MAAIPARLTDDESASRPSMAETIDAPVGPSSEEESMFLAQEREMGIITPALVPTENPENEKGDLPPMEDLVKRIPAPARELMEQLFRPHFVTVKRFPRSALKS